MIEHDRSRERMCRLEKNTRKEKIEGYAWIIGLGRNRKEKNVESF